MNHRSMHMSERQQRAVEIRDILEIPDDQDIGSEDRQAMLRLAQEERQVYPARLHGIACLCINCRFRRVFTPDVMGSAVRKPAFVL